jgi:transposase InsO family protein
MSQPIHPIALFRLSVLGALTMRMTLNHGELKQELELLAARTYTDTEGEPVKLAVKTLEGWYYAYRKGGIEALTPRVRIDRGVSKILPATQDAILAAKRNNPRRSLRVLIDLLEQQGVAAKGELKRSSVHRLLKQHGLSRPAGAASEPIERRRFEASHAGDLWQGDVMHGPQVLAHGRLRKVYLVALLDDASRLIPHAAFCIHEGALAIEGILKQALLKRGRPVCLLVDNGSAYRSASLQGICARLDIRLLHSAPYEPQSKGKIERFFRTVREQFLSELDTRLVRDLDDLNARLWAWLDQCYHARIHGSLNGLTPLQRYQRDLPRIQPLGALAAKLDALFQHRHARSVRKDGTVSYQGQWFEVPYELAGQRVVLVVDPHRNAVLGVENEAGEALGQATPLDVQANCTRKRRRATPAELTHHQPSADNAVELALQRQRAALTLTEQSREDD